MVALLKRGADKKTIKNVLKILSRDSKSKGVDVYSFVGRINLKEGALKLQKELRDEWERFFRDISDRL
ncbi:hypothetical protein ESY86_18855 [Subsaximicrobium wynnwilliamsii]|uniref:Uncharacterized protein n=1 Tax=Subsaximicrobium wynnwilliamsii TaxID=291179 RepID=A0A5C6ZC21_9FLAO|nr:hypothetical protein [Subsaximicrobium wynnwilliamsii]TXD81209.1 hypothetical protein ESY87_18980 [Subsaximicrobium wynnwilliamsii]TXD86927.1 hypothetical protein ESY86_18855 [Subsaximicrobium wynnwilliamsii]TXE00556.1 hypothetical protein ESY88_19150 [Subsaximicrobium wynnwilliamsii]